MTHGDVETADIGGGRHVEIYPGTEIMEDYLGSHLAHSHNEKGGIVLVPQPSHEADDPLVGLLFIRAFAAYRKSTNKAVELEPPLEMDYSGYPSLLHSNQCYISPLSVTIDSCIRGSIPYGR